MKVLYIINNTQMFGANRSLLDMFSISNTLIEPVFLCPDNDGISILLNKKNYKVYILSELGKNELYYRSSLKSILRRLYCAFKLIINIHTRVSEICKIINKEKIEIVHTNNSCVIEGAVAAKKMGIPHIWHVRETLSLFYKLDFVLPHRYIRSLFNESSRIIAISDTVKTYNYYIAECDNVSVIYDGITIEEKESYCENNKKVFVIAGYLHPYKGFETVIEATKLLKDEGIDNFYVWIIGDGTNYMNYLKAKVIEYGLNNIIFLGYIKNVSEYFAKAYCGLMCSYMEGLGRTTVEFMLCGRPVIGSNSGGTTEIIEDGKNGFLFEYGDANSLAQKMKFALNHPEIIEEMGKYAKVFAEKKFSTKNYFEKIFECYKSVLNE